MVESDGNYSSDTDDHDDLSLPQAITRVPVEGCSVDMLKTILRGVAEGGTAKKSILKHEFGGDNWKAGWEAALNAMGGRRTLPDVNPEKSVEKEKEKLSEAATVKLPYINTKSSYAAPKSKADNKSTARSADTISKAVSVLPRDKQLYLLQVLTKLETDLGDSLDTSSMDTFSTMRTIPKVNHFHQNSVYGHIGPKNEVNATLKRIATVLHADKKRNPNDIIGRGKVELLGPTALRERLASEYKLQLTTHEITLLMKKFDHENRGLVNIVDIFGNALLLPQDPNYKPVKRPPPLLTHKSSSALYPNVSDKSLAEASVATTSPNSAATKRRYKRHMSHADDALLKLQTFSMQATKQGRMFRFMKLGVLRVSQREFRHILQDMHIGLTSREELLLMKRYIDSDSSTINLPMFIEEFKRLGAWDKVKESDGNSNSEIQPEQVTPQKPRGGRLADIRRLSKGKVKKSPVSSRQGTRVSPVGSKQGLRSSPLSSKQSRRIVDKRDKQSKKVMSRASAPPPAPVRVPSPASWNNVTDPLETVVESEASARRPEKIKVSNAPQMEMKRAPRDDIFANIVNAYPDPLQEIRNLIDVNQAEKVSPVQPKAKVRDDIFSQIVQAYPDSGNSNLFSFSKPSKESTDVESHSPFKASSLPPVEHSPSKPRNTTELMAKLLQAPSPKLAPLSSTEKNSSIKSSSSVSEKKGGRPPRDELFSDMVNRYPTLEPVIKVRTSEKLIESKEESKQVAPTRIPKDDIFASMVNSYPTLDPVIIVKSSSTESSIRTEKSNETPSRRAPRDDLFAQMVQSYPTLDPVIEIRKLAEPSIKRPPRDDLFSLVVDSYPTLEPVIQISTKEEKTSDITSISQVQTPFAPKSEPDFEVEDDYADESFEASGIVEVEKHRSFNQDDGNDGVKMHRQNSRDQSDGDADDFDL